MRCRSCNKNYNPTDDAKSFDCNPNIMQNHLTGTYDSKYGLCCNCAIERALADYKQVDTLGKRVTSPFKNAWGNVKQATKKTRDRVWMFANEHPRLLKFSLLTAAAGYTIYKYYCANNESNGSSSTDGGAEAKIQYDTDCSTNDTDEDLGDPYIMKTDMGDQILLEVYNSRGELLSSEIVSKEQYYTPQVKIYKEQTPPNGCRECGGDWPNCKYSCPMYDD